MTDEVAVLGVSVDPTRAQSGAREAVRSLDDIKRSAKALDDQMGRNQQGLDGTSKASADLAKAMNGLQTMVKAVAAAFGLWKLKEFMAEAILLASRIETLGVVVEVVGRNIGKSKREMDDYVQGVKAMGITTQESINSIIQLAQAEIDLSQASKLARTAQDAAVVGNTDSSNALNRMVYGIKSAQPEMLRTLGLQVSFEQSYDRMATALKKNASALNEQEKVQARTNAVIEAGRTLVGAYEMSMLTAGKMLGSLARLHEELRLKIGETFSPTFTVAVFAYAKAIQEIDKRVAEFGKSEAFKTTQEKIQATLKNVALSIAGLIDLTLPVFQTIGKGFDGIIDIYNGLPEWMRELGLVGAILLGPKWGLVAAAAFGVFDSINKYIEDTLEKSEEFKKVFGHPVPPPPGGYADARGTLQKTNLFGALNPSWQREGLASELGVAAVPGGASSVSRQANEGPMAAFVRQMFKSGEATLSAGAPALGPGVAKPEPPRTDINIISLQKANEQLVLQAENTRRVTAAMEFGETAVAEANLQNKVRVYVLEKLNGSTKQAEEILRAYTKAARDDAEATAQKRLKEFEIQKRIAVEYERRTGDAVRDGSGSALRNARIENAARGGLRSAGMDPNDAANVEALKQARLAVESEIAVKQHTGHMQRMDQMDREVEMLEREHQLRFANGPDKAGELAYLKQRNDLIAQGYDENSLYVAAEADHAKTVAKLKASYEEWAQTAREASQAISRGFEDAILGAKSLKDSLYGVVQELQRIVLRKAALQPLERAIEGGLMSFFPFSGGGIMTSSGPLPLRKYAGGGIARSPQLAMFGEGSVPEAYVPVPTGKIPVELSGAGGGMTITNVFDVDVNVQGDASEGSAEQLAEHVASQLEGMVTKILRDQMRSGNLLNPAV